MLGLCHNDIPGSPEALSKQLPTAHQLLPWGRLSPAVAQKAAAPLEAHM